MIRKATEQDIPSLVEMGKALHDESTYKAVVYSPERVAETCKLMISHGFAMVSEKGGEVVGVMMGDVVTPWYSTDRMGFDYTLYIKPEHRNGITVMRLITAFEAWCKSMGAKQIRPGIGTGIVSVAKLYKSLGYRSVGEYFLKDME